MDNYNKLFMIIRKTDLLYEDEKHELKLYLMNLQEQVKKQKEVIDKITEIINYYGIDKEHNDNSVLRNILKNMLDILKEVNYD